MYKSIFYKEWIKTRQLIAILCIVFGGFIAYTLLKTSQGVKLSGAVNFLELIVQKDVLLVDYLKYLPLLAGVLMAVVQLVPEMQSKRLKLTLHLPLGESKILLAMLAYGFTILLALFVVSQTILLTVLAQSFPAEIITQNLTASLPWFLAGIAAYFFGAWVCMEPTWRQRIVNVIAALCGVYLFFLNAPSGGYITFLPYLLLLTAASFFFSYYSVARFKDGAQ